MYFAWDYDSFIQRLTTNYIEGGGNDKLKEVNVCKLFVDFVKSSIMNVKLILKDFTYL